MCGRFTLRSSGQALAQHFELSEIPLFEPRYNIAPTQPAPVVRLAEGTGRRVLDWLRREVRDSSSGLRVHLGYGRSDPFAQGSTLLEALLPAQRCIHASGGHDWPTWSALWASVLDQDPFEAKTERTT